MTAGRRRIAVTGVGMVTGLGNDTLSTFRRLMAGESAIRPLAGVVQRSEAAPVAAWVPTDWADCAIGEGDPNALESFGDRLAGHAAYEAIRQANLLGRRCDVIVGASTGATREGIADCAAARVPSMLPLVERLVMSPIGETGHRLVRALGTGANATVVCSACSSGALAIAIGAMRLEQGCALPQVVGGTDTLNLLTLSGFEALGAMSDVACRPFDEQRAGLSLGEGAGFVVLETASMVASRGARVLAWLDGYAIGAEAHHLTHPDPEGERAAVLIREAIERAGLTPADVDYVNAHGTATIANDEMECRALRAVLGAAIDTVDISSSKGQIGHTLAAAGAIEVVIAVQSIVEQAVPPTAGLSEPAAACKMRHVSPLGIQRQLRAVLSNSFGFGGTCAVLALRRDQDKASQLPGAFLERVEVLRSSEDDTICVTGVLTLGASGIRRGSLNAEWLNDRVAELQAGLPFEPLDLLVMDRSRRFDRLTAMTALACEYALAEAGLAGVEGQVRETIGLVLGNALGPVGRSVRFVERILARGAKGASPAEFPHLLPSSVAGNASIYASLRGPVFTVSDVGTTIQSALELGINCIRAELAQAMLVGTSEARDQVIVEAQQAGVDLGQFQADVGDGSAFLCIESRRTAVGRGARGCELAAAGWFDELSGGDNRWPRPEAGSRLLWAEARGTARSELPLPMSWTAVSRRQCVAQPPDGWSHPGFVLAAGAGLVLAGECPSTLVVTSSSRGLHYAIFRRSPLLSAARDGD